MDQDPLLALPRETRLALVSVCERLKHDIGRYVTLQQRWLPAEASADERRAALHADLLHTRRDEQGSTDVFSLWEAGSAPLFGRAPLGPTTLDLAFDPDIAALQVLMLRLGAAVAAVRAGRPLDEEAVAADCRAASSSVTSLTARARRAAKEC